MKPSKNAVFVFNPTFHKDNFPFPYMAHVDDETSRHHAVGMTPLEAYECLYMHLCSGGISVEEILAPMPPLMPYYEASLRVEYRASANKYVGRIPHPAPVITEEGEYAGQIVAIGQSAEQARAEINIKLISIGFILDGNVS